MVEFAKILKKAKKEVRTEKAPYLKKAAPVYREEPALEEPQEIARPEIEEMQETMQKEIKPLFPQKPAQAEGEIAYQERVREEEKEPPLPRPSEADTTPLYEKMTCLARELFRKDVDYAQVDTKQIVSAVAEAAGAIVSGDEKLVELSLTQILKEKESYLLQHCVNISIISLQIGSGLNYEMGRLVELGITAFLHDIGMCMYEDMSNLPRKLTQKEYEEIKKHVDTGSEILKKIDYGLSEAIIAAQYEIHERMDGSGYPRGKKSIHDYARIIALADGFESMIHPRPFRARYSIMEVYKRIFDAKNKYDQNFIKVLVDKIGFFPNGTFVQLNTKEVGKVIRQNPKSPLRPVVRIAIGPDGVRLYEDEIKEVNLVKYPTIHVKKCFLEGSEESES